jgi:hypothetical protein
MWVWSLNHSTMVLFTTQVCSINLAKSQIWETSMSGNDMMMGPAAHPQLMNVLNHLVYVWSGCGNHSMSVWSLFHCTMVLFVTQLCSSNLAKISISGITDWRQWHDHGPSCPSNSSLVRKFSITLYMSGVDVGTIFCGSRASITAHDIVYNPGVLQ